MCHSVGCVHLLLTALLTTYVHVNVFLFFYILRLLFYLSAQSFDTKLRSTICKKEKKNALGIRSAFSNYLLHNLVLRSNCLAVCLQETHTPMFLKHTLFCWKNHSYYTCINLAVWNFLTFYYNKIFNLCTFYNKSIWKR